MSTLQILKLRLKFVTHSLSHAKKWLISPPVSALNAEFLSPTSMNPLESTSIQWCPGYRGHQSFL